MGKPDVDIPWPLSSAPGASPQESSGRLFNCYAEPLGPTGPSAAAWRRSAGVSAFATTGFTTPRGLMLASSLIWAVVNGKVVTISSTGVVTVIPNALPAAKRVTMSHDNNSPTPNMYAVDLDNGAFTIAAGGVNAYTGGGVLPQPNSVSFQDGFTFFTIADKRVFATGLNSTAMNALTFTTIQSVPSQQLLRGIAFNGMMYFFTNSSYEVWNDTAQPFPAFPYSRYAVRIKGLAGPNAIAGWEEGFGNLIWVGDDNGVYQMNGVEFSKISPPDLDRAIFAVADKTTLEASCYVERGHSFWVISSPTFTWEYNINTQRWNERGSLLAGLLTRWRGAGSVNAFGGWYVGDFQTGNVLRIDPTNQFELTQPLLMRLESGPVQNFPNRVRVARADFDFVTGVGIATGIQPIQTGPQVSISWSDDDGVHWSNPLLRSLGVQANGKQRVYCLNLGQSGPQGRRWRLDISDPVYAAFMGGTMSANPRAR